MKLSLGMHKEKHLAFFPSTSLKPEHTGLERWQPSCPYAKGM